MVLSWPTTIDRGDNFSLDLTTFRKPDLTTFRKLSNLKSEPDLTTF